MRALLPLRVIYIYFNYYQYDTYNEISPQENSPRVMKCPGFTLNNYNWSKYNVIHLDLDAKETQNILISRKICFGVQGNVLII